MEQVFTKVIDLLYLAQQHGIEVVLNEERLQLKVAENNTIDKTIVEQIRENKDSIIDFLSNNNWKSTQLNGSHKKITPANRQLLKHIPLSYSQERLWFIDQLEGSVEYHSPTILRLRGVLDTAALERSLATIVDRHEVLRTVFKEEGGIPYQQVKDAGGWHLDVVDGSHFKEDTPALQGFIERLVSKPFDLSTDHMLRAHLINVATDEHVLVVVMHHIASDAWSIPIIIREVAALYRGYVKGDEVKLPALALQYADYAIWQRNYLTPPVLEEKINYWKNKLEGVLPLQLPTDYKRSTVRSTAGAAAGFKVDKELLAQLHKLSQQQGSTLYMLLLAAFKVLLYRYTGQSDISVGTSIANRTQQEVEGLIGFFVNTLAFRDEVKGDSSFIELLQQVKTTTLGAYEHQEISFEKVVETVVKERDPASSPLFQVMLVLQNTPEAPRLQLGELSLSSEGFEHTISKFDLTFFVNETGGVLQGMVQYRTDLFRSETIERLTSHFTNLLRSITSDPLQKVGTLSMMSEEEHQKLLNFNDSSVIYPADATITSLFEAQVQKTPQATALVYNGETLSYEQLNATANRLAHYLRQKGVKEDTLVPVFVERSIGLMTAILGILKAGAAYVPIDTDFPGERISYMLKDSGSSIVISSKESRSKLETAHPDTDIITIDGAAFNDQPTTNPTTALSAHHLAYVIYTSGSTGQPKGVMIEHRNLVDYVYGLNQQIQVDKCSSYALVSSIATDLGNTVIYSSLVFGGALHLFSKEQVSNIEYLHNYFQTNEIDCLKIVPSHWKALSLEGALLLPKKLLVFGGEALQSEIVEDIKASGSGCKVINHYGPTETTIGKLLHITEANKTYNATIPIGKPFSNTKVFILSKELQLSPAGVPGQLYIAGDGVARGYLNNEELTQQKFIQSPFTAGLMYGTGDLVKYLPDGNIEFIGRADDQVKIRGYRVEIGEIESILQQSELVSQAVVMAREDKQGNKRLVGYVVAEGYFEREEILSYLKEKLPEYMVPSILVEIESLPLTANGKVDRKALPDPDATEVLGDQYVAPRTDGEARLAEIWQDVLEVDQVGIHDDFFELGGHSLLAVRLISAIRKAFVVEIPISHVFDYPTVAQLASQLNTNADTEVLPPITAIHPRPQHIPLSFSQERLWFIDKLEGSVQYHVPAVVRLQGKIDKEALGFALQQIVQRHEVLRTVFREEEGKAYQVIQEIVEPVMQVIDGKTLITDNTDLEKYIKEIIAAPFNLSKDAMLRAHLIVMQEEEYVLVVTIHHIASDGWSRSILVGELAEIYAATTEKRDAKLTELPIQYADFSLWQRGYLQGETLDKKLNYWKQKLEGVLPLNLPTDHVRPAAQGTHGGMVFFQIDKKISEDLQQLSQKHGATLYMTLLSAFNTLLYRYSNQEDIAIGTPIAGRLQQELESLIGFFVNTLTIRSKVQSEITFTDLLEQVKATTMEAYANQEIPFEKVVEAVVKDRETYRNPLFQVMFILRNTPDVPELRLGSAALSRSAYQHNTSLFDLSLFITETPQGLNGALEFSTDIYTKATIERMVAHFTQLLGSIVARPNEKVGLLEMVTDYERTQLLVDFNNTKTEYPQNKSVVDLFEAQVQLTPAAIALAFENNQLTYQQLNERANKLARYLTSKGIQRETLVPICVERGVEMIVGILAILKAGAAFVPIDPEYPQERIKYILKDIDAKIILSTKASRSKLIGEHYADIIELDTHDQVFSNQSTDNLHVEVNADDLAYIIYTSGSTGVPKGVMVEHHGVTNTLKSITKELGFNANSSIFSVTTYSFDIFYVEFFMPLINGGKLIVVSREVAMDGYRLAESILQNRPTHIQATPSTFQILLESGWENKEGVNILMGGEAIKEDVKEKLVATAKVWNGYGPTETTIYSTITQLQTGKKVLIGKPIANTNIYILSKDQTLCAVGIAGELCIAGAGLARGYLNRQDLTSERFVKDPFSKDGDARMYRTGDLARWVNDGEIEYLGRIDYQVKIRGYRIELGEIESVLQQSGFVTEAVVIAKADNENNRLMSYYTPDMKVVKEKETALYQDQVNSWKDVYDIEYEQNDKQLNDEEFDIGIWKDSFTGSNIPEEDMRQWVQEITDVILSEDAGEVLEIGCGTGLIYYQLAGKVKKYIGTDFSASSVNQIRERISKGLKDYGPTELQVCAAHEVNLNDNQKVDTIVINSVIQYFPGEEYMNEVIVKSISLLKNEGRIIIGDVRDKRLLDLFKGRLQLQKLQRSASVREFNWLVDQEVLKEEELCFTPEYFYNLKSLYPQISHVEITWKQGDFINELSLYRYNVVIYVGEKITTQTVEWKSWRAIQDKRTIVNNINNGNAVIAIKDAPNFRLYKERALNETLKSNLATTVGELADRINFVEKDDDGLSEIINAANQNNYHCSFLLDEDPLVINLLLEKNRSNTFVENVYNENDIFANRSYTNIPLFTSISSVLQKDLKALLSQRLPEYMVPAEFIALSRLPLTANGKVDRLFLTAREERGVVVDKFSFQAARTIVENKLTIIWQQLLGIDLISVYDNFFDLGGHSLLGMRLISAIRKELEVELSIKDLFTYPTIASLSTHLGLQSQGSLLPSIEAVHPRPAQIPLSFSQERLWFLDRLEGSLQYHIPSVLRLKGRINTEALASALQTIVNRHEVLRTVFIEDDGHVYQHVKEADKWQLSIKDAAEFKEQEGELEAYIHRLINQPFNLSEDDMIRAALINVSTDEHLLVVTLHHIASDGWSTSILVKELVELYQSYDKGKAASLAPLNIQYADFALWQRSYIKDEVLHNKINYWKQKLQGVEPLQLPTDFSRPVIQSTKGGVLSFAIDKELTGKLQELSQKQSSTMFMTLLAAFKVLLYRYSGQKDICVGTPIAGRQQQEVENLIGFFINTLALRDEVSGAISFNEFLQQVKSTTLDAYEHQDVPFEKVVDAVMLQRDMSRSPLFQVMFILQNAPDIPNLRLGDVELSAKGGNHNTSKFDITFSVTETSQGLRGAVEFATALYQEQTIEQLIIHFKELISSITNDPQQSISVLPMLTQQEKHQLLVEFNKTQVNYPKEKTIVDLFEEQVQKTPEATALVFEDQSLTYQELNERSNQLAHFLTGKGVKAETLVPICIERSVEMIVGILGILKAGGAYIPIDPDYPEDRIEFILHDTAAEIVVTSNTRKFKLPAKSELEIIEIGDKATRSYSTANPSSLVKPGNIAYIIYTSGSTGKPKGVMIEHKNVVRLFKTDKSLFDFSNKDVWTLFHSFSFDFSVWEIFGALLFGGKLVVVPKEVTKDVSLFSELILKEKVTVLNQTPSAFEVLQQQFVEKAAEIAVRYVIFGGEALNPSKLQGWKQQYPHCKLVNMYGITETTVHVTYKSIEWEEIKRGNSVIGRPIPTLSCYILDDAQNLVPSGVAGELYVGGAGVARGYLNMSDLTAERFIKDIFSKEENARLYKTGDVGKWLPDGNIEFLGRIDDQVKIRGYRIELGEIENVLLESGLVSQTTVLAKEDGTGNKRLVAYVVKKEVFKNEELVAFLNSKLPDYMVPALWVELKSLPLTSNGKIDKKALPAPDISGSLNTEYVAPRNTIEARLAAMWQKLLNVEKVGIHDNFFQLGGHSLMVMRVVSAIRKELTVEIPIRDLFTYPTIASLSTHLGLQSQGSLLPSIEAVHPRPAQIPLSFSQERLWFLDRLEGSLQYHIPSVLRLKGRINTEALASALQTIVNRHEVLRTVFIEDDGHVYQHVKEADKWQLSIKDAAEFKEQEGELEAYIHRLINQPFNLSEDDMIRAALINVSTDEHLLVVTLHHIASDGWSTSILVKELVELYQSYDKGKAASLAPLNIQYADFALWQRSYIKDEVLHNKINYWKQKLQGVEPLQLPTDFSRPVIQSTKGGVLSFAIDKELTGKLQELSQKQSSTMFMTLLAAFKVLLYRYSGQKDICVGTPIAGRQQQEVENLIGFFINTLALRDEVSGAISFNEFLQQVKSTTLDAYEHQDVPFEKVVDAVMLQRDMSRSPLFQVMFILQNAPDIPNLRLGDVELSAKGGNHNTSKFDITFSVTETSQGLRGAVEFATALYQEQTIEQLIIHFKELISSITNDPQQSISVLPMLTQQEKHQLLVEFNKTQVNYPKEKTIVDLFEEQVQKTPEATALVFEDQSLTYQELNERSNQLAHFLTGKGVKAETLVPICIERSVEMIVGILGILKAGGAYIPIDPDYPEDRIEFILHDTAAPLIVSSKQSRRKLNTTANVVEIDKDWKVIAAQSTANLAIAITSDQLAYVIFTSGTTGKPKGVMIENRSLVNLLTDISEKVSFNSNSAFLSVTTYSFDICYLEFYMPLINGGKLIVVPRHTALDGFKLAESIAAHCPTHMQATPSTWDLLLDVEWENIEQIKILIGGEAVKESIKDQLTLRGDVYNLYGPTETTIWSTIKKLNPKQKVLIGQPIANTQIYIVDDKQELLPIGVVGEIVIGGAGVARGYLNRPTLTGEKFVSNSFIGDQGARMYKTGDLGRWLPDGNIEYVGRKDDQVKIRGYRIELGEIESVLVQSKLVDEAVVVAKEDKEGNKSLVGYVISKAFNQAGAIEFLKSKLPGYMVPLLWVHLEHFPLTPNGKIDRKSLPAPDINEIIADSYVAPRTTAEARLAQIWQEVLGVEQVGINNNFFELGGHSLLGMRLISAIRKELTVEIPIRDLFTYPTIASLSTHLGLQSQGSLLPSIEAVHPRPAQIPLSFSQERLWFLDRLEGSLQYHIPSVLRLKGRINTEALASALQTIVNRHEVLRTVFIEDDGHVYQHVKEADKWQLSIKDAAEFKEQEGELEAYIHRLINQPFNLSEDDMIRAALINVSTDEHLLVVTLHHIASDGWSTSILVKELVELYQSYDKGKAASLAPLNIQYADFALWQRSYIKDEVLHNKINYWKQKLQGVEPLQLPTDFSRPVIQSTKGGVLSFAIDKELTGKLQELSQKQSSTMFMTLLAAFKVLLYRYSGQKDICVGTPIAGRQQQEVENLIGFFINTLALRDEVSGAISFNEFLQQVKSTTLDAYEHQDVPFEKVVDAVMLQRDMSRSPLFQVMFILQNAPDIPNLRLGDVELSAKGGNHNTSKFDITFSVTETSQGLRGAVEFATALYQEQTIEQLIIHFKELISSITNDPQQSISVLPMLTQQEKHQLLVEFNKTQVNYPKEKTIVDLFEEQVQKTPEATALVFEDQSLTYQELNERSNQLAHFLTGKGVKAETLVPICIERSVEMIVGILGILKAGGAYIPIDPDYPEDRIEFILHDTAAPLIVSSKQSRRKLNTTANVVEIDKDWKVIAAQSTANLAIAITSDQLAYVIFTSGTTGKPKGVMIENRSLVNLLTDISEKVSFNSNSAFLSVTTYSFDICYLEFYMPLINGGKLIVVPRHTALDGFKLAESIAAHCPTHMQATPSTWDLLLDVEWENIEQIKILIGGEAVKESIKDQLTLRGDVYNLYGPTETTIWSTIKKLNPKQKVLIGQPIANTQIYIVDDKQELLPIGVVGEIVIGGAGVARGYLNRPTLTGEKFVSNSFIGDQGARMYKTGDLGRWLPDGNIEYVGRKDDQVKIRGYRIELGEIESVLVQSKLVDEAVVVAKEDKEGNKSLVGYVISKAFNQAGAIEFLKSKLPGYMVPLLWVHLEHFPLTPNGKIDRKSLPAPDINEIIADSYVAPRTTAEARLAQIWQEVLGVEQVGINNNFFELGGHSLLGMRLISAIRKELEVELSIKDLFTYPTIASLSTHLGLQSQGSLLPSIEAVHPRPAQIPLSFSQERLWFLDRLEGSLQYHIPSVLRLKGRINTEALASALQTIVNRHEVLRTVFIEDDGHVYQHVKEADKWQLSIKDAAEFKEQEGELEAYIHRLINQPFNLSEDDMIRAALINVSTDEHLLVVTLHHIASDGWSTSILVKELVELYQSYDKGKAASLAPLNIQYADFALWQRSYIKDEVLHNKINYWKQKLQGVEPLQLPTDFSRPVIQSTKGGVLSFAIDKELTGKLQELSQKQSSTMFMTLLAAFKVLLYRYSGQKDICVGTPIAGRQQQEVENLIGFFINTLALRDEVSGAISFNEFLQQVKSTTLDAYEHQDVPFEKVVDAVMLQRDMSRSPLFQVMFILQNAPDIPNLRLGDVELSAKGGNHNTSKFDITFSVTETSQGLRGAVEFATALYQEQTIEQLIIHFKELISSITNDPQQSISVLPMLTQQEKHQLLVEFNKTQVNYPKEKTIVDLFEEQVQKTPEATALVFEDQSLTYQELNERSNQLAHFLTGKGVKAETLVPICIERSVEMIVGILGILKAGGAYIPIDPDYPEDRIEFILHDTAAPLIVSSKQSRRKLNTTANVVEIDKDWKVIAAQSTANLAIAITSDQLAYVIFTSGTTGKPKGVMIENRSLVNLLTDISEKVSFNSNSAFLSVTTYSFDICYLEFYMPLINGGKLIVVPRHTALDGFKLAESIAAHCPTHMQATPSTWDLLLDVEWENIEQIKILIGGEAVKESIKDQLTLRGDVYNLYGPTETTIWSTIKKLNPKQKVLIGQPIANTQIYIVDDKQELLPIGVVGEIVIGGAGVARGYLNRPTLTGEKFVSNSFIGDQGARMYKTGDLGRWLPDGNIEYVGRKDDQVKIRGYRIELGEIESVLVQSKLVDEAVVVAKEDKEGNKSLVGYVISKAFNQAGAIEFLKSKLPGYMVPLLWVHLEHFPLTPNGKIDRKSLPAPDINEIIADSYVAPRTTAEARLAQIWQEVLGVEQVGINNNFFELGGYSMLAVRLIAGIKKEFDVEIPIGYVFNYPTIALLAAQLQSNKTATEIISKDQDYVKSLVPIKKGKNKCALYIICGTGGTAFAFKKFADMLDPNQPVFGVQQIDQKEGLNKFPATIEGIAARYLEEILIQNPDGPYALAGHCAGGIIAFEMAKQIKAMGKEVRLLAMLDTIVQNREIVEKRVYNGLSQRVNKSLSAVLLKIQFETFLLRKHPKQAIYYKVQQLKSITKRISKKDKNKELGGLEVFHELSNVYRAALTQYRITPYDGEIIAFYAKEHYYFLDKERNVGFRRIYLSESIKSFWKKYSTSTLIYEIEGEHSLIFDPIYAGEFSKILQEHLNA